MSALCSLQRCHSAAAGRALAASSSSSGPAGSKGSALTPPRICIGYLQGQGLGADVTDTSSPLRSTT